jgi:hypothetical protein
MHAGGRARSVGRNREIAELGEAAQAPMLGRVKTNKQE